ncbi:hypothetical protein [Desulfosporosinus meridiei]|uniref:RHS repeat protein n=1 Tax=Desulfosporosinus meridiei (strain ATCC BAA-275 / DSM 13257 / KCTC 12902 / NCIMB 13706 / S10) TaxID=768704 RepID=J7IV18_DESMD|nr:hypothetical protein [Desulfosporosinus meridiei]AFQ43994.1 hypothetical protein Desmer_2053 [Desulfosporosinus meridiei DSM 13257]
MLKVSKPITKNNSNLNLPTINVVQMIEDYQGTQPATTNYEWNKNTLTKVIEPNKDTGAASGSTHTGAYDGNANLTQAASPNNLGVSNTYDAKSNPTKVETNGTTYDNLYDAKSNLRSSTNNLGLTDYNTYDKYGNTLTSISPTRATHNRIPNSNFEIVQSGLPVSWNNRDVGQYSVPRKRSLARVQEKSIYLLRTEAGILRNRCL